MDLVPRIQGILLRPKEEWAKIKEESLPITQLFTSYVVILAAIPAIAQFIGLSIFGGFRVPYLGRNIYGRAFFYSFFSYIFSIIIAYLLGFIINTLAPNFSSTQNKENAMKLAVFSLTPMWIAGVLYLIPFLGPLAILGSLYGLYILYLGFDTPLLETPKDKIVSYFLVTVVVGLVLVLVISVVLGAIFAVGVFTRGVF